MKSRPDPRGLDPRSRELLRTLIAQHIRDGEPVGSRTLARASGLDVSAATIRNIMADLEDMGLLSAPHTSAGRIPTAQGYRVFVDSLLQVQSLPAAEMKDLRSRMPAGAGTQALLSNASEMLSAMSHFVGVVTVPQRSAFAFRMIDFVALDAQRVLVILVFTDNEVQNRIITTRRAYSPSELEQTANYLNQNFAGRPLSEIRTTLLRELREVADESGVLLHCDGKRPSQFQADLEAGIHLETCSGGSVSSERPGTGGRRTTLCHSGVPVRCRGWLARPSPGRRSGHRRPQRRYDRRAALDATFASLACRPALAVEFRCRRIGLRRHEIWSFRAGRFLPRLRAWARLYW